MIMHRSALQLPRVVAFILRSCAIGAILGAGLAVALVLTNAGGMGALIASSSEPAVPLVLLVAGFATLIGSLYAGWAIMTLPRDAQDDIWFRLRDR